MKEGLVKTLLHHILGIFAVLGDTFRHRENTGFVTQNQSFEGRGVAAFCSRHQRSVGVFVYIAYTNRRHDRLPPRHCSEQLARSKGARALPDAVHEQIAMEVAGKSKDAALHAPGSALWL